MVVIYGTKIFKKKLGYSRDLISCENCKCSAHWEYLECREWGTVFFIPLFPSLFTKEVFCCPECKYGIKVDKYNEHRIAPLVDWLK